MPNICGWIKPHLGKLDDTRVFNPRDSETARETSQISALEYARLSVAVIAALADTLHSALVNPDVYADSHLLAQEQDSIEFVIALLPRLLDLHRDIGLRDTRALLSRHRSVVTVVQKEPTLFPSSYPVPLLVENTSTFAKRNPAQSTESTIILRSEVAASVMTLLHIAPTKILKNYLQGCLEIEGYTAFSGFLSRLLETCRSFLTNETFPQSWLNISMLAHKAILKVAEPIAEVMQQYLIPDSLDADSFDVNIWKDFFQTMLNLLSSPSLVIEDFSPARQRAVWRLAGDIRGQGSKVLLKAWKALSWPEKASRDVAQIPSGVGGYQAGLGNLVSSCLQHTESRD